MHHINISYLWNNKNSKKTVTSVGISKRLFTKVKQVSDPCFKRKWNTESSVKKIKTFDGINVSKFTNIWITRHTQYFFLFIAYTNCLWSIFMKFSSFLREIKLDLYFHCRSVNILAMESGKEHQKSREKTLILTKQAARFAHTNPSLKKYSDSIWICNS